MTEEEKDEQKPDVCEEVSHPPLASARLRRAVAESLRKTGRR